MWDLQELYLSLFHSLHLIKEFNLQKTLKIQALKIQIIMIILLIDKTFIKKALIYNKKMNLLLILIIKLKIMLLILELQIHIKSKLKIQVK